MIHWLDIGRFVSDRRIFVEGIHLLPLHVGGAADADRVHGDAVVRDRCVLSGRLRRPRCAHPHSGLLQSTDGQVSVR
jgi:hypothetical protein